MHEQTLKHKKAVAALEAIAVPSPETTALTDLTPLYRTKEHRRALECFRVATHTELENARLTDALKPQDLELAAAFMIAVQRDPWVMLLGTPITRKYDEAILHHLRGAAMEGVLQTVPLAYNHALPTARRRNATVRWREPVVENEEDLNRFWRERLRSSPELDRLLWFMATAYNERHAEHAMADRRLVAQMLRPTSRFVYIANNGHNGRRAFFVEPPPAEDGASEIQRDARRRVNRNGVVLFIDETEHDPTPKHSRSLYTIGAVARERRCVGRVYYQPWHAGLEAFGKPDEAGYLTCDGVRFCTYEITRHGYDGLLVPGTYARLVWDKYKGEFQPGSCGDVIDALTLTDPVVKAFMATRYPDTESTGAKASAT